MSFNSLAEKLNRSSREAKDLKGRRISSHRYITQVWMLFCIVGCIFKSTRWPHSTCDGPWTPKLTPFQPIRWSHHPSWCVHHRYSNSRVMGVNVTNSDWIRKLYLIACFHSKMPLNGLISQLHRHRIMWSIEQKKWLHLRNRQLSNWLLMATYAIAFILLISIKASRLLRFTSKTRYCRQYFQSPLVMLLQPQMCPPYF